MTETWNKIANLAQEIEQAFNQVGDKYTDKEHEYSWYNALYSSLRFRRAHIEIVDNRESHGIYILHSTVFPHYNDPSPIWGFDAVCGKNKITGAFHDFSSAGDPNHEMIKWFKETSETLSWSKPRNLPEWAKQIFSPNMVAAGNIREENEIDLLCHLAKVSLKYYLENVGLTQTCGADFHMAQNRYCHYQKQNPQVVKSMVAMGVPEPTINKFVEEVLFPETV
jgi:hypothetical protein